MIESGKKIGQPLTLNNFVVGGKGGGKGGGRKPGMRFLSLRPACKAVCSNAVGKPTLAPRGPLPTGPSRIFYPPAALGTEAKRGMPANGHVVILFTGGKPAQVEARISPGRQDPVDCGLGNQTAIGVLRVDRGRVGR